MLYIAARLICSSPMRSNHPSDTTAMGRTCDREGPRHVSPSSPVSWLWSDSRTLSVLGLYPRVAKARQDYRE